MFRAAVLGERVLWQAAEYVVIPSCSGLRFSLFCGVNVQAAGRNPFLFRAAVLDQFADARADRGRNPFLFRAAVLVRDEEWALVREVVIPSCSGLRFSADRSSGPNRPLGRNPFLFRAAVLGAAGVRSATAGPVVIPSCSGLRFSRGGRPHRAVAAS